MTTKEQLVKLLSRKQSREYYARRLKISVEQVNLLIDEIRNKAVSSEVEHNLSKGEIRFTSTWSHAPTAEEIVRRHKMGENYTLSQFWSKEVSGGYKVSANFKEVQKKEQSVLNFQKYLDNYKSTYIPIKKSDILLSESTLECSALIDLTDFHLDKKGLFGETIEQRVKMFKDILQSLVLQAYKAYQLEEIVFVVGSDMLHTDTFFNTTTNGTPQDVLTNGEDAYSIAFDLYADAIQTLKQFCKTLKVVLVLSNHSRTREYFLSHALSKYFEKDSDIVFDISPTPRKVHVYGETFTGFHHGNCKIDELPLVFAKEYRELWGKCRYHQIVVGDKHFYYEKEIKGVRIKQLPALADTDRWHNDNNYVENIRAGICSVYEKNKGKIAEFEERYNPNN